MLIHGASIYDVTVRAWCVLGVVKVTGPILGAFARFRITIVNFVLSVRLSEWNNSTPTERIFMKRLILVFFENVKKIQVYLKFAMKKGYFI